MLSRPRSQNVAVMILALAVAFCTVAAPAPKSASEVAAEPRVNAAIRVLDAWIQTTVTDREQPGLSIGIVYDQEVLWSKGYGFADLANKTPATPATLYRIASISKLFTTTAIMQLRDAGKLQLDDPVAKHLDWFQIKNRHPEGPTVTIRHLVTHTSGLPRESVGYYWSDLKFPTRDEMIQAIPQQETVYPAETEWKYSNLALSLAGEIVAAVSGEPYPQYIKEHVLRPLGMSSTLVLPEPSTPGLAVGYRPRVPGKPREVEGFSRCRGLTPAANLASSVEDLAKFAALQFRSGPAKGAQILKGSTLSEMQRVHWLNPNWDSGWGLGFGIRRVDGEVWFGHGGHVPGHTTNIYMAPKSKLAVIVLTNADDGDPGRYIRQAFKLIGPAVTHATKEPEKKPSPDPEWEKYTGVYTRRNRDAHVMVLDGKLTMIRPDAESPWQSRMILEPVAPHTFRMTSKQPTFGPKGELLKFDLDSAGRVTRLTAPGWYMLRK